MKSKITLEPEALTKEQQIELLERQLQNCKPRDAAAISRQLSILKGDLTPGVYQHVSPTSMEQRRQAKQAEEAAAEQQRREQAGALPIWWSERQCKVRLYYSLCDTVSAPDFDGTIEPNPQPTNAISKAINQLWISLSDSVKQKLQRLATEQITLERQQQRLSGNETVQFLDRALETLQASA
jgi:hypothetical protein